MSQSVLLSNLFALTDTLSIPHQFVLLTIGLIAVCALYRWGGVIFLIYALAHLCAGHWTAAILAIVYAGFIAFVRTFVSLLTGVTTGCSPRSRA